MMAFASHSEISQERNGFAGIYREGRAIAFDIRGAQQVQFQPRQTGIAS
jgi:hypothetical protein